MLKRGDRLFIGKNEIGVVVRLDGDEACWIARPTGGDERWNVRVDELPFSLTGISGVRVERTHFED